MILAALRTATLTPLENTSTDIGLISNLGKVLFKDYVLPFEISSVLFLSAMIGAIVLGTKPETVPHLHDGMESNLSNNAALSQPVRENARTVEPEHDHYEAHS